MIISSVVVLLLLVVGVTYAFFTYESGTKSDIVTGQIYMNYEETSTISLTGVFPETKEQALSRNDENGVFEFIITGRNTSKYPVYYEIDLLEGGVITGKTEQSTKILPEHVMIYLEKDGVPVIEGETYADFNNRRIYTETIPANQTSNIEHKYTLRMWIDENVTISDTNPDADYTTSEWNDAYTSLKVRVVGDFEYKEVATDASCFTYNVVPVLGYTTYDYLTSLTLDTSEEKVDECKAYMGSRYYNDMSDDKDGYQSFCEGTGTIFGGDSLKSTLANHWYTDEQIQSLGVVESYEFETRDYKLNTSEEGVNACMKYIMDLNEEDGSDAQDGYQSYCEGTGTAYGISIFEDIDEVNFSVYALIENNILIRVEELPQGIEITDYDVETCGTDVVIPSYIEGFPVETIASKAFEMKGIIGVKLPDTLRHIGEFAFAWNGLSEVTIPDSVTHIGMATFWSNILSTVILGRNVSFIGDRAFLVAGGGGSHGFPNPIERIINKSGNAFNWKNILDPDGEWTVQDPGVVATGTYVYYNNGNREIQITSE